MRNYFFLGLTLAGLLSFSACEDEPTNPGDFSLKSTLSVESITSNTSGPINFVVKGERDTTLYSGVQQHIVTMDTVWLESPADTMQILIRSNTRWNAPNPDAGGKAAWFFSMTNAGGGDAKIQTRVVRNRNSKRSVVANQRILTADSTRLYIIPFLQKGERDK